MVCVDVHAGSRRHARSARKGPSSGARPLTEAVGEPTADGPGRRLPIADAAGEPAGPTLGGLDWLNALPRDEAVEVLLGCCAAPGWARRVADGRPHRTTAELLAAADAAWADRGPGELDAAMAGHPRIGERGARWPAWSRQEQSGVGSDPGVLEALRDANVAYERPVRARVPDLRHRPGAGRDPGRVAPPDGQRPDHRT